MHHVIRSREDVRLAGVTLAFDPGDYPITGTNNVATLRSVYPAMIVKHSATPNSISLPMKVSARHSWVAIISYHGTLARLGWDFACVLEWPHCIVHWMIAVLVPLSCFDYYWFLSVFHFVFYIKQHQKVGRSPIPLGILR
jgi:hypothetical protein